MAIKTNLDLAQHCKDKKGVHYLYGAKGDKITQGDVLMWSRMYPKHYGSNRIQKALSWAGEYATDCSGLISWYTKVLRNSDGYYNTAREKGSISTIPELPGMLVWKPGHIGVYIGGGQVIEARGFNYGVVQTPLSGGGWTHWLKCCDITYIAQPQYESPLATIQRGDKGPRVGWLQERLNELSGSGIIVDADFGAKTVDAVTAYQKQLGWTATGKAGEKTINALHDGRKQEHKWS